MPRSPSKRHRRSGTSGRVAVAAIVALGSACLAGSPLYLSLLGRPTHLRGSLALGLLIQKLPEPSRHQTDAIATRDVDLDHCKTGPFEAGLQPGRQLIENRQRFGSLEVAETTPPLALSFFHVHVGDLDLSQPGSRANKSTESARCGATCQRLAVDANIRTRSGLDLLSIYLTLLPNLGRHVLRDRAVRRCRRRWTHKTRAVA